MCGHFMHMKEGSSFIHEDGLVTCTHYYVIASVTIETVLLYSNFIMYV